MRKLIKAHVGEIIFSALFAVPLWLYGTFHNNVLIASLLYLGLIGFYILTLFVFGNRSAIEMGIFVTILAVLFGILFPTVRPQDAKRNKADVELRKSKYSCHKHKEVKYSIRVLDLCGFVEGFSVRRQSGRA